MEYSESYAHNLIARVHWTWAKTYVSIPHEYIVRGRCGLTDEEFAYLVHAQREHGIPEQWHKYNFPYLYIDGYKYWTMGDPIEDTTIINRQKVFSEFDELGFSEEKDISVNYYGFWGGFLHNTFDVCNRGVYEVGCGTGVTYEKFYLGPTYYLGVDPSKKAIEQFKQKHPELSNRLFVSSFEESVNYWSKGSAVVLATFGAPSYFMRQYLEILAKSGQDYFLMFYSEGYCPEEFKSMHHFDYSDNELGSIFSNGYIEHANEYRVITSKELEKPLIID